VQDPVPRRLTHHLRQNHMIIVTLLSIVTAVWVAAVVAMRLPPSHRMTRRLRFSLLTCSCAFLLTNYLFPATGAPCADCFRPHGLPFTYFREGGFAGGGGIVWLGAVADAVAVAGAALLFERLSLLLKR